jgi:3-hydroxyacyl-CoA dehydrogenase
MDTVAVISRQRSGLVIAATAAIAGYDVVLVPVDEGPTAECLRQAVRARFDRSSQGAADAGDGALARMCIRPALEAIRECSLVVDCAGPGDPIERTRLLRRLEASMSFGAVLATADPAYERLGEGLARPTQFLGFALEGEGLRVEPRPTADTAPGVTESARLFCRTLDRLLTVSTAA